MHRPVESPRRLRAALFAAGLVTAATFGTTTIAAAQSPDGKVVFSTTCAACHQASGEGVEGTYPPLAGSEIVEGDDAKVVRIVLHGLTGPVEVAGETYSGAMPPWGGVLKDPEIAAVITYVRGAFGNHAAPVTAAKVASIRASTAARKTPWTAPELAAIPASSK